MGAFVQVTAARWRGRTRERWPRGPGAAVARGVGDGTPATFVPLAFVL